MSKGNFITGVYQDDLATGFFGVRVQPETTQLIIGSQVNAFAAGAINRPTRALVTGRRRQNGLICRTIGVKFTGSLPDGYKSGTILYIPVFRAAIWRSVNPTAGLTGTYLGQPVVIVSKQPEYIN